MLKFETPINFDYLDKTNNNKKQYLSYIRDLTNQGNYFSLIKFIENSTPNVSLSYFNYIYIYYSFFPYIQRHYFIFTN